MMFLALAFNYLNYSEKELTAKAMSVSHVYYRQAEAWRKTKSLFL